jgi:hypothetical protein
MPDDPKTAALEMAHKAELAIMKDLEGRSCIGHALERIDDENPSALLEIKQHILDTVAAALLEVQIEALERHGLCTCIAEQMAQRRTDVMCELCAQTAALRAAKAELEADRG